MATLPCRKAGGRSALQPTRVRAAVLAASIALFAWSHDVSAQQTGTITGRVTDGSNAQPLASAQVSIANLSIGVLTQQNGRFILLNVPAGSHTLSVQRIGYQSETAAVTVAAGGSVTQDFVIDQEALALDEIIVTGTPGGSQRRAIGNSVERVNAAEVTERAVIGSVQELMAARTPGVRFGRTDGQVGGGSPITIRGVTSLTLGSQPLIYVDGVRVSNDSERGPDTGSAAGNSSALNDINPDDIESIEVIKGPAAATLYGTEASAGVIQIITKKGAVGAPEFTAEIAQGTNFMIDPAGILGTQYACAVVATQCPADQIVEVNMYNEANDYLRRAGRFAGFPDRFPGTPTNEDLFGYGRAQRYSLSARGGTDNIRYYLGGTYSDDVGIIDYNTDNQTALRANVTVLLPGNLNIDVTSAYSQGETRFGTIDGEGGAWHQLVWSKPNQLPGLRSAEGGRFVGFQERFLETFPATNITRDYSRFISSATTTHNFRDWLTQRLVTGIDRSLDTNNEFLPGGFDIPEAPRGALRYSRPIEQNVTLDYAATARLQATSMIGTATSIGAQYYSKLTENFEAYGKDFPTPGQQVIDQTDFGNRQLLFSSIENKSLGFYIQEELSFNDRIFLTGAVRADDNSAFGSEFDLQYYPKFSGSWVLSEEPFFTVPAIDNLRLRGAWGKSGRQPDTFASQTLYTTFLGPSGNGLIPATSGNAEVGPEVSTELELGFDVAVLDQRLSGEFSWYNTVTRDVLVNAPLPPSTGLVGNQQTNIGQLDSRGWEANISARVLQARSLAFDLDLAADHTKNEVIDLGGVPASTAVQEGWPFPAVQTPHLLRTANLTADGTRLDQTSPMCDGGLPARDGGPAILQGGPTVRCDDYTELGMLLGPAYPTYTFTVGPTLTVMNNLQVFALAEGQYGKWGASVDAEYACRFYDNCLKAVEGTDPLYLAGARTSAFQDDRFRGRFPADYWRLRQVGMRYSIPQSLTRFASVDRAAFSLSASNIWTIWQKVDQDLSGNPIYDPGYFINSSDPTAVALYEMPGIASINASLRVTF